MIASNGLLHVLNTITPKIVRFMAPAQVHKALRDKEYSS